MSTETDYERQFESVYAEFQPTKTDNLANDAELFIGHARLWTRGWIIEEGDYEGQWAMMPNWDEGNDDRLPFAWAPECDLTPV